MISNFTFSSQRQRAVPDVGFKPQLTSLVDMMTILLVFLIKSFSADAQIVTPGADLELPISTSQKPPRPRCSLEISRSAVMAEGRVFSTLTAIARKDQWLIDGLYEWMKVERSRCEDTARAEVMILSDRDVTFDILKRVMYTCSKAGFSDFSLLVRNEK